MADDPTDPAPPAPNPDHVKKSELEAHKREWEAHVKNLKDEMAALHAGDVAEREKLKTELQEAKDYIEELKKAEAKRDEVKDSKSTMVLPPNDIPPQQPSQATATPGSTTGEGQARRPSIFKRAW